MEIPKGSGSFESDSKFSTPEEELKYLREQVALKERVIREKGETPHRANLINEELETYKKNVPEDVLSKDYRLTHMHKEAIVLDLTPELHDEKMGELLGLLQEKGVLNALSIVEKMNNPHIEDDFHRFLVQYIKGGLSPESLPEKDPVVKSLHYTLYEVSLPEAKKEDQEKNLKEMISSMEQFYAGMLSVEDPKHHGDNYMSIELAVSGGSEESIFYVAVPQSKKNLFEKQILSIFPQAKLFEKKDDYNIFNPDGFSVGAVATHLRNPIYPLKTYEQFDYDPLNVILNTFSKLDREGEGAAIQLIFNPAGEYYVKRYKEALNDIQKGVPLKKAIDIQHTLLGELGKTGKEFGSDFFKDFLRPGSAKSHEDEKKPVDESAVENIKHKIESPIVNTNVRIIASAKNRARAMEILSDIESAFNQFDNTLGNAMKFEQPEKAKLARLFREYAFRVYSDDTKLPLNLKEITTFMHFPGIAIRSSPHLKRSKAGSSSAPFGLSQEGILLGINKDRNVETKIFMSKEDRLRHFYTIGQTGTGKTNFLKNMIIQDIHNGEGVCMIDPHGSDIQDVLANIPPERYEDVIYFDPSYTARPMGLNMLEYDRNFPEQKTFVVNELFSIFQKLYGANPESMGPMFEQYFRNSTMLVLEDPDTGNTLLDVSRVMVNKTFRDLKLSHCKNPIVVQFWKEVAEKAGGEGALANIVPYITSKFDVFLANDIMRPVVAQEQSSFDFRDIMDKKKILLVNLAKGRLGAINSNLIGLILVGKILMAALSRVDSFGKGELPPFYLYIDEFQNVTTDSISTILSEARKYKLSLTVAHQFIAQLDEKIKDSVFGNVGTIASFRVGAEDAEYLEKQFSPVFTQSDIMNLDNYNAYIKLLSGGVPVKPFNIVTLPAPKGNVEIVDKLKELSYLKFGRDRGEVEEDIMLKYKSMQKPIPAAANPFSL
jgi:hypothetical protein